MPSRGRLCTATGVAERRFAGGEQYPGGEAARGATYRGMTNVGASVGRFKNLPRQTLGPIEVPVATTPLSRLLGLALLELERAWPGLLIPRCRSVHSFGMGFPLRIHFLDDRERPLRVIENLPPGRVCFCPAADSVLELVPGVEI